MNKLGMVLGVTAVVAFAGCVDPNYRKPADRAQNNAKTVETPAEEAKPVEEVKPVEKEPSVEVTTTEQKKCTCAAGTKHTEPCACGASDCKCVVEKPTAKPAEKVEETTTYIVQRGDYLAKISKKYNVTIASIKRVNPQLKDDVIKVGQKIKLPGKIDVGEQKVPAGAMATPAKSTATKAAYKPYTGATKEYVVKGGDTLGAIAYGNGITIRQLKELNGLKSNNLRIGDKLKIPAEKVVAAKAAPAAEKKAEASTTKATATKAAPVETAKAPAAPAATTDEKAEAPAATATPAPAEAAAPAAADAAAADASTKAATEEYVTYEVQEGEDIVALSLRFGIGPGEIRSLNNLGATDQLKTGQKIRLPADTQQ